MERAPGERAPLEERAAALARTCSETRRGNGRGLRRPIAQIERTFGEIDARLADAKVSGVDQGRSGEWLLDNAYLVSEALYQVTEGIPPRFYHELPKVVGESRRPEARVYLIARAVIGGGTDVLDLKQAARFIESFQSVTPLTMGELWAFPMMLRFVLLQDLSEVAARAVLSPEVGSQPALAKAGRDIGICVTGLRLVAAEDWKKYFESSSLTERSLRNDPARVYSRMDFETRDQYRKAVEKLANRSGVSEERVAAAAIAVSKSGQDDVTRSHVGFYLVGAGSDQLYQELACEVPFTLRVSRLMRRSATTVYLTGVLLTMLGLLLITLGYASSHGASSVQLGVLAIIALIPVLSIAVSGVHWLITHLTRPRVLFKMDFEEGIPADCRAIVVVPTLLTSTTEVRELVRKLEVSYHGNRSENLSFALLTDFADAPSQSMPGDDKLLEQAVSGIQQLNAQYNHGARTPFFLLHRERRWNDSEGCWMGWERKRGKLVEFNHLLLGSDATSYHVQVGDMTALKGIRYAVTLDADTGLPRNAAARLVATLAHPLNRAQFDDEGRVTSGYTVLQPRIEMTPGSATSSLFATLFHSDTGLDLYTRAVSDVYQDFFGEGIYAGKGVYDVVAFDRSVAGRIPENALLSHDLFEGVHGRAALASDLALFEEYPDHVLAYTRRMHRWIRGDWQLLPWLRRLVPATEGTVRNRLSVISRWKIFDNLRRSLVAPSVMTLITVGWLWMPGSPWLWMLLALAVVAIPILLSAASMATRLATGAAWSSTLRGAAWSFPTQVFRFLIAVVFLPYEALVVADAVVRTLYRLRVSRRFRLQWTSAAHTARVLSDKNAPGAFWRDMFGASLLAFAIGFIVWLLNRPAFPVAAPLVALWVFSPQLAWLLSRPRVERRLVLPHGDRRALRLLARRTWHYFERFIGPSDHWLAPDNYQEEPLSLVAQRTSPTNQGLALIAPLGAFDFGYMGALGLAATLRNMVDGMTGLERYRGHFLNWYETVSRTALLPRYVSTVDSGNLAACLIVLRQAHRSILRTRLTRRVERQGLLDTADVFVDLLRRIPRREQAHRLERLLEHLNDLQPRVSECAPTSGSWRSLLVDLKRSWLVTFNTLVAELLADDGSFEIQMLKDLRAWSDRVRYAIVSPLRELDVLQPWVPLFEEQPSLYQTADGELQTDWQALVARLAEAPTLRGLVWTCTEAQALLVQIAGHLDAVAEENEAIDEARRWNARLGDSLDRARQNGQRLLADLHAVSTFARDTVRDMDFRFLFDEQRQLFRIGYNVSAGEFDTSYYDLLASEARIASMIAIAKGDVPVTHWLHLRRPFGRVGRRRVLLSWSGTMFEFLMPNLFASTPKDSVLGRTSVAAVRRQIAFAQSHQVPWGISESGFYQLDAHANYQYRAFGVPGLGLRLELGDRIVIAPYASVLALSVSPPEVVTNLERLAELGMLGQYGLFEAMDYGPPTGHPLRNGTIVRSYMTHHQGMIFQALNNFLNDDVMVRRFHSDPRIASTELVLFEQAPRHVPVERRSVPEERARQPVRPPVAVETWLVPTRTPVPQLHVLSNRRVSVLLTANGGGHSRWRDLTLTRWRSEPSVDAWGTWMYLRDLDSGAVWSVGYEPTRVEPAAYEVEFAPHMAEYSRHDQGLSVRMNITVPPSDDVEIRRVTIVNDSDVPRHLVLTSYGEVVLGDGDQDRRHQAFNKLFVQSNQSTANNVLVYERRRRSADEDPVFLAHGVAVHDVRKVEVSGECDREAFLGHRGTRRAPAGIHDRGARLSVASGTTLDPIFSLSCTLEIEANAEVMLVFVTSVGTARSVVLAAQDSYRSLTRVDWAFDQSRSYAEYEMQELGLQADDIRQLQEVLSALLHPYHRLRSAIPRVEGDWRSRSHLWAHGISGDHPILLIHVGPSDELDLVRQLLVARTYWRRRHVKVDIVIVDEESTGYLQPLHDRLEKAIVSSGIDLSIAHEGIFLLNAAQLDSGDRALLEHAASVALNTGNGSLGEQLSQLGQEPHTLPRFGPETSLPPMPEALTALPRPTDLQYDNGLGGFSADGREYVIHLESGDHPPAPWINVIANPQFGFLVSESGGGYTWAENSGENRLTSWHNDPVSDQPSEVLYLRDEETARIWTATSKPAGDDRPYQVRHGAGYTEFRHISHGIEQRLVLFAAKDDPIKLVRLTLKNLGQRPRRLTATYFADWVLGSTRDTTAPHVVTEYDGESGALLARNPFHDTYGSRIAFLAGSQVPHALTADRTEFLGQASDLAEPPGLYRIGLSGATGGGLNPCGALQLHIDVPTGEIAEVHFMIGQGRDCDHVTQLVRKYRPSVAMRDALQEVRSAWDERLGALSVVTPDRAMDVMLNRWMLYQTVACRLWGRSGLYQSSGAFGFRDQLQDVMALVQSWPELARAHILEAARHQFTEGDVLHWWHPGTDQGVRTRCSDDLVWLPFVTAHYVGATGDRSILTENVPFLQGPPLGATEHERYSTFEEAEQGGSLYHHCLRALEYAVTAGPHQLPLIGTCDWNDGFSRVGIEGRGESIWLAWFLYATLTKFAPLCELRDEAAQAQRFREQASFLKQAVEADGWDGEWYRRAYYDDGTPIGSAESDEAQIDSIAQSWSVLSGGGDEVRVRQAVASALDRLVRRDDRIVLLLSPPFNSTDHDPGYIKGYPPGVRENGGQYTHAAAWLAWAVAQLGDGDEAHAMFRMLNPVHHSEDPAGTTRYRVEPYVVAADVYGEPPHIGRGGWTWYTGSSAWLYRLGVEGILGIRKVNGALEVAPCIPKAWKGFRAVLKCGRADYRITVENPDHVCRGVAEISVDGREQAVGPIPLVDDGEIHDVVVRLGKQAEVVERESDAASDRRAVRTGAESRES